ncbi:chloride channel protein [Acetobacteraceae bacterium H6797]|nr:chloride channel protein [Acetobacteraceae bacterium H6797]
MPLEDEALPGDIGEVQPREGTRAAPRGWIDARLIHAAARLRGWVRRGEVGLTALGIIAGILSGTLASAMGAVAKLMHGLLFGPGVVTGLSTIRDADSWRLLLLPAVGGLVLGLVNILINRWRPRQPVDPIEANALYGGRMSRADGIVVAVQNLISNGFGASVGLEAGYTQVGGGFSSWLGQRFGLRRGDLRILVGCGAAGAIAAAFDAPLTGAFYAFELVIGSYAIASLAPVVASAVAATLTARLLSGETYPVQPGGVPSPDWQGFVLAILVAILCAGVAILLMRGVVRAEALMKRCIPWAALRPAVGGLAVGAMALLSPGVLSAGHGALHVAFNTEGPLGAALLLLGLKALASGISIGAGFRGGLFFASLLLGALLGKIFAGLLMLAGMPPLDPLFLALVGMSAFGTAVIGAPLAMTFLALESTGNFAVAGAVLTAVTVAGLVVRRTFGYSFATWRFHLRGETIRSAHDIGWLRELTVGRMMRRDVRTVRSDMRLTGFRREFPLGATELVVAVDEADRYAGIVVVAEAHSESSKSETVAELLRKRDVALQPAMNAKEAMAVFDRAEAEALAVVDGAESRKVIGLLTASHVLRRYGEALDQRRREEMGD